MYTPFKHIPKAQFEEKLTDSKVYLKFFETIYTKKKKKGKLAVLKTI